MWQNTRFSLRVLCVTVSMCAHAATMTDFSGTWKLNADRSDFGVKLPGPPPSQTIVITQTGDTITVKTIDATPPQADMTIKTDGTDSNIPLSEKGKEATASATWDGSNLAITIRSYDRKHRPIKGMGATAVWSLSADGKTLNQAHRITDAGFVLNARLVFDKQGAGASTGVTAQFRDTILAALHAAEEPEPFATIRGEFDLASPTGAWKTLVQLPDAEKCLLMKTSRSTPSAPALWTYLCIFRPSITSYERVVTLVQSSLTVDYRRNALTTNEVVFSSLSELTWRVVVTKSTNPAAVMLRIAPQQLVTSPPDSSASAVPASRAALPATSGAISDEIEKIKTGEHVPFPPIQPVERATGIALQNGLSALVVKNDTAYTLSILLSGPIEQRVDVAPGDSISIELLPGAYRVAARVNAPEVSPSYGEHVFDQSTAGVTFYIR